MNKVGFLQKRRTSAHGQSLVETALFLPIILFLLAGALEISNMLVTQNRVQTAARAGAGFGATNYDASIPLADTFEAMSNVALNNVEDTLDQAEERWDIYTVKATVRINNSDVNYVGDPWDDFAHPYGDGTVFSQAAWDANESQIAADILNAFEQLEEDSEDETELEIIAAITYHDRTSFLGLGSFNPGLTRIRGLTVMRVSEKQGDYILRGGCDTFPIALSAENYSVWPSDKDEDSLDEGHQRYPLTEEDEIHYTGNGYYWPGKSQSQPPPYYTSANPTAFPANVSGIHITQGKPGYIYIVKEAGIENDGIGGAFGWLRWDENSAANNQGTLETSLKWPGNSTTYKHSTWSDDGIINKYDIVKVSTGTVNSDKVRQWMREHVEEGLMGRQLRLIVFTPPTTNFDFNNGDANGDGHGTQIGASGGQAVNYEVYAFVRVRIVAWKLTGQDNHLLVEFLGWDDECTVPQ